MPRHRLALLAMACIAMTAPLSIAAAQTVAPEIVQRIARASFPEFLEMLSLPNDSINAADIKANAAWLETAFQKRGFVTRQLDNSGKPVVFAEFPRKVAGAATILFYMHFDGMPVIPSQWAQKNPHLPVLKQKTLKGEATPPATPTFTPSRVSARETWEEIDAAKLTTGPLDPEWRIFARSSSDDKAPIMMFLAAFDALKTAGLEPAFNVKVLLDSEEEKGSPQLGVPVAANRETLRADAILMHDGPMHPSNLPTIVFGNRGNAIVRLVVYGPKAPLHSGHYGNYVANPAQRLAALLASMKDDDGRVKIAGYYDGVKLTDAERRVMSAVPDDEAALRARLGIARAEKVGANLQEALQYPSLNVRGMQSAAIGEKGANIIPSTATAELDLRTTPGASASYLTNLIEKHLVSQGYYLTPGEPTDEERAKFDKIATLFPERGSNAAFTDIDSPVGAWVQTTLANTFASGGEPAKTVRIRMMGGTVPTDKLIEALETPFVIVPLVNSDNNQHSFDENLRVGHYMDGVRAFLGLLRSPYPSPKRM